MKASYLALGLPLLLLLFGCVSTEVIPPPEGVPVPPTPEVPGCRVVTVTEPFVETECMNVTFTEEVCNRKALAFEISAVRTTDLCTVDGDCVGHPLSDCPTTCDSAMKRCKMNVTNLDAAKSGTWKVGALYMQGTMGFEKDPASYEILPGQTHTFDFTQLYDLGPYGSSLTCDVYVVDSPEVEDCHDESRVTKVCEDVTRYRTIEREVCD